MCKPSVWREDRFSALQAGPLGWWDFWSGGRGRDLILWFICKNKAEVAWNRVQRVRANPWSL